MKPVVGFLPSSVVYAPSVFTEHRIARHESEYPVETVALLCSVYLPESAVLSRMTTGSVAVPNTPLEGVRLMRPATGEAWWVGIPVPGVGLATVEVSAEQVSGAIREGILPGGILRGAWCWVRLGNRQHLVRVGSAQYVIAAGQAATPVGRKPLKASTFVPGRAYLDHRGRAFLYLGEVATVSAQCRDAYSQAPWDVLRVRGVAYLEFGHTLFQTGSPVADLATFRAVPSFHFRLHLTPRPANFYGEAPVRNVTAEEAVAFTRDVLLTPNKDALTPISVQVLSNAIRLLLRSTATDPLASPVDPQVFRDLADAYRHVTGKPVPEELATDPLLS